MAYNINNVQDFTAFKGIAFDLGFAPIASVSDLNSAIAAGALFQNYQEASAGHRDTLTYMDIAQVAHAIREIMANPTIAAEVRTRCKNQNISVWQDQTDAAKDKPANIYQQYVMLLRGVVNGTETELSSSWKNNLRVVRHLVECGTPSVDLFAYIATATEQTQAGTLTKLEAIRAKDAVKYPSKTKPATAFSATKAYKAAAQAKTIASVSGISGNSYEGFRVLLVRDGDNDNHDVVAVVDDQDLVKKVLRNKFAK